MFTAGLHHYELLKIWKLSAIKETTIHFSPFYPMQ